MRDRFALFDIELAPRPNEAAGAGRSLAYLSQKRA
jgi:hypothetical protein